MTTFCKSVFSFHCVRGASNPIRSNPICLVLDTATTSPAVHGSPQPLYPSSFKCAPAFTPELSRDLPGGPGCAHESSWGLQSQVLCFRAWMSIIILNRPVFHLCFNLCFRWGGPLTMLLGRLFSAPQGVLLLQSHLSLRCVLLQGMMVRLLRCYSLARLS